MSSQKSIFLVAILGVLGAVLTYYVAIRGPVPFQSSDMGAVLRGMVAPDFELAALEGGVTKLENLRGNYVLINFWATWCQPCLDEMPSLEALYRRYKSRKFVVLAINMNERSDDLKEYVKETGLTFPILLQGQRLAKRYGTEKVPESYVIDPRGIVKGKIIGAQDWTSESTLQYFDALLGGG